MSGRSITNDSIADARVRRLDAGCPVLVSVTRKRAPDRDSTRARNGLRTRFRVADEVI